MSGTSSDDEAWQAIVDNYGERPEVDEPPAPTTFTTSFEVALPAAAPAAEPEDRFVPPDPGPLPRLRFPDHLPWLGVLGIPAAMLVALLGGLSLPAWLGYLMVAGFVGSFVYLVLTMKRGGRDPWDDGARV